MYNLSQQNIENIQKFGKAYPIFSLLPIETLWFCLTNCIWVRFHQVMLSCSCLSLSSRAIKRTLCITSASRTCSPNALCGNWYSPHEWTTPLSGQDYNNNYIWTTFVMDKMSQTMTEGLMLVFKCFGYPSNLVSYGAPNLVSCEMMTFCHSDDIKRNLWSPFHPSCNCKVESVVKIMKFLHRRTGGDPTALTHH